jgi:hypothetical protein
MDPSHRTVLRRQLSVIIRSLAENPDKFACLVDDLTEKEILTWSMREEVLCERTPSAKARSLMGMLPKRGPACYGIFVETLNTHGFTELVQRLEQNAPPATIVAPLPATIREDDSRTCEICMEMQKCFALIPCGHVFCAECSSRFAVCPVCRHKVLRRNRVYF